MRFPDFWSPDRSHKESMEAAIAVISRPSLLLSLFCLVTSNANYAMSEALAIVRIRRHRFLTKRGQFNGCLHACLREKNLVTKFQKRDELILVPSQPKFDILESFVLS